MALLRQVAVQTSQRAFVALVVVSRPCLFVARTALVQRVVCQVHEHVSHDLSPRVDVESCVRFGGKPHESLLVKVDLKRVARKHKHVQTNVKFQSIDQIRRINVLLNHTGLLEGNLVQVVCDKNSFTL